MAKDYLTFRLEMKRSQRENRTKKSRKKKRKMFRLGVNINRVYKGSMYQNGVNFGKVILVHPKWNLSNTDRSGQPGHGGHR